MRKKCVRRTKFVRATLIVAIAVVSALAQNTGAQSIDPSTLPRLTLEHFQYLGGFRLPRETVNGDSFAFGGDVSAYSPATNSLFVSSRASRVAEVTIPNPVLTSDVTAMPFASFLQPFADPTEGRLSQVGTTGVSVDGMMIYGDRLYGTANVYYDASNAQRLSHFSRSLQLNQPSFSGWSQVWETGKAGFVSGFMSVVPAEWRALLGGPAASGQCCIPIVTRTSWGPAALTFDPANVGQATVPATPLVYYDGAHPTLGNWSGQNATYGATTMIGGMAFVGGTRTALFLGRNGLGPYCYGNGTGDASLQGLASPDGSHYCYDPTSSDKGTHAYPYHFQIWAYDLNDLAAVKAGTKQPWEVVPYGVWPFDLPTYEMRVRLGGVSYDAVQQRLYVTQLYADKDGYQSRPIIHVFQLDVPPAPEPPPPPVPVKALTISADKTAPQAPNTQITFTATPTDGVAPYQYKWLVSGDGTNWSAATDWTTSETFVWTPASANANAFVGAWVRSSWNTDASGEATAAMPFPIAAPPAPLPPAPAAKVTAVTIAAGQASPVITGTATTWTATATGGATPVQYKWMVHNGSTWIIYKHWSTENTLTYIPGIAGTNKVSVAARSAGSTNDLGEASVASSSFTVVGLTMVTPLPPPQTSAKVLAVFVAPDKAAPQPTGSTVTWSAVPIGGTGPTLYKWFVYDGTGWIVQGGWTSSPTFAWTPPPNAKYRVSAWAKNSTNTADVAEASMSFEYVITGLTP